MELVLYKFIVVAFLGVSPSMKMNILQMTELVLSVRRTKSTKASFQIANSKVPQS